MTSVLKAVLWLGSVTAVMVAVSDTTVDAQDGAGIHDSALQPALAPLTTAPALLTEETDIEAVAAVPAIDSQWPNPTSLLTALDAVDEYEPSSQWADAVRGELALLRSIPTLEDPRAAASLERLSQLADLGAQHTERAKVLELRIALLRARYGVLRRVSVWKAVHAAVVSGKNGIPAADLDGELLLQEVSSVEDGIGRGPHCVGWRNFLQLEPLQTAAKQDDVSLFEARKLARKIVGRVESQQLADAQRKFLDGESFVTFRKRLRLWAAAPLDYPLFLQLLEEHEQAPSAVSAKSVADNWNQLRWSPHPEALKLADPVNVHYRNANVRMAVHGDLLNRMLPIMQDMEEPVNDTVLGSRVFGQSRTSTHLAIRLIPDQHRWRMGLEVRGDINSQTQARVGMVRLFNRGESSYLANQLLLVGRGGVELDEPEAGADARTRLTGVRSDVDVVPIVGWLVRGFARSQHDSRQGEATREVENKIAWRVRRHLAEEVGTRVEEAERQLDEKLLTPLRSLELEPVATQMMTTKERLIMRCRLAGYQQLAANTARPRAPADSLLSVQIHQSAANNVIEQLNLDGKTYELGELYLKLSSKFGGEQAEIPENLPEGVSVRFADENAVQIQFEDGLVLLTIRLTELDSGRRKWQDFEVRGYYRPETGQRNADLVRKGTIQLVGEKLGFRDQIALRAIFSKVFSRDDKLELLHSSLANDSRLEDVRVTQFAIDHGWIGVAISSREGRRDLVARPVADEQHR